MKPPRTTGTLLSRGLISRSYLQSQHHHRQRLPCRDSTSISSSRQRSLTHLHLSPTPTPHHAEIDFTSSHPASHGSPQDTNERTIKLGRTLRILQSRLPTLLLRPLPTHILSPTISLHLFPSTHPHLPRVSGRVAYLAALWTSPLAWGKVPLVSNVRLSILSERMLKSRTSASGARSGTGDRLIVKWRTQSKTPSETKRAGGIYRGIAGDEESGKLTDLLQGSLVGRHQDEEEEFTGLFIFEFDEEGRVGSHTIEHVDSGEGWEGVGWVGLTDWLLGKVGGRVEEPEPALAWSSEGKQQSRSTG